MHRLSYSVRAALLCLAPVIPCSVAFAAPPAPTVQPLPAYTTSLSAAVHGHTQAGLHVFVDGGLQRVIGVAGADGNFVLSVPLKREQLNRLSVFVSKDSSGLHDDSVRVPVSTTQDDKAPFIRAMLSRPANAAGWHRAPVTVHFLCSDQVAGLTQCPAPVLVSTPGVHQVVHGEAIDRAGNRASASVEINLDTSAPKLTIDTPGTGKLVYQPTVHLHGSVGESLSGVAAVNCNSVVAKVGAGSFDCDVPLVQGTNAVRVWAIDMAGNVGQVREQVVLGPQLPGGDAHQVLISAHLNGHRNVDTVRTDFAGNQVVIREGNGDGTFQPERHLAVGPYPSSVAVADVNGDGVSDILTTHYTTDEVGIQYGQHDGSFVAGPRIKVDAFPSALVVRDINGDGHLDLIVASATLDTVRVYTWKAAGAFVAQAPMHVGHLPVALAIGSVASRLDILSANYASDDVSLLSSGALAGQFLLERRLPLAPPSVHPVPGPVHQTLQVQAARQGPSAIALGDINGDKLQDIVTANYLGGNVSVLSNIGKGQFSAQVLPAGGHPLSLALADLSGDGRADIAVVDGATGQVRVLANQGAAVQGTLRFVPLAPVAAGTQSSALIAVDLDGDGKLDLVSSSAQAQSIALSQGAGHFVQRFAVADAQANPYVMYLPLVAGANGLPGGTLHHSLIEVHNVAPAASPISITFVREDNVVQWQVSGPLPAGGSAQITDLATLPAGWGGNLPPPNFRGAAIVSAARPFHARTSLSTPAGSGDQHLAVLASAGAREIDLPRVVHNWEGASRRISVQNVGKDTVTVAVVFRPALPNSFDQATRGGIIDLEPGQSRLISVEDYPLFETGGKFRGHASLATQTSSIVAVALEENRTSGFEQVRLYQGIGEAQREAELDVAPLLINADRGIALDRGSSWSSELTITNAGFERTDVTVTFGPNQLQDSGGVNLRSGALPPPEDLPLCGALPPRGWTGLDGGQTFWMAPASVSNCRYMGSAHISSSNGQPLAAVAVQKGGMDSSAQRAIGHNDVGSELFLQRVRALDGPERASSEIAVSNLGDFGTSVTFAFEQNRIAGVGQPPDIVRFLDAGQTMIYGDLAQGIVHYVGSVKVSGDMNTAVTPGTLPKPARLAAVVTDVPALRAPGHDQLSSYTAQPLEHTNVMLRQAVMPVGLLATPCQAFINEVFLVRDGAPRVRRDIPGSTVHPVAVPPLVDVNRMQTEDEEINQRASAQGIILTRHLPTFITLDPINGPVPVLLSNTNETFGDLTNAQASTLMVGTTARTRGSTGVYGDAWLQLFGVAAGSMVGAALGQGASKAMQDNLEQFDWYNGPLAHTPNAPSWDQQQKQVLSGLQGPGAVTAIDDSPESMRDLFDRIYREIINPPPPPAPDPDHCSDGFKSQRTFKLEQDWTSLYLGVDRSRRLPTVTIYDMTPKNQAYDAMCQVLRRIAACLKEEATPIMFLQLPMLFLPNTSQVQYFNSLFGEGFISGDGFRTWGVDFRNTNSPGYRCVTYP